MKSLEEIKNEAEKYFRKRDDVVLAFLFGSYALGKYSKESDIDMKAEKNFGIIQYGLCTWFLALCLLACVAITDNNNKEPVFEQASIAKKPVVKTAEVKKTLHKKTVKKIKIFT